MLMTTTTLQQNHKNPEDAAALGEHAEAAAEAEADRTQHEAQTW